MGYMKLYPQAVTNASQLAFTRIYMIDNMEIIFIIDGVSAIC